MEYKKINRFNEVQKRGLLDSLFDQYKHGNRKFMTIYELETLNELMHYFSIIVNQHTEKQELIFQNYMFVNNMWVEADYREIRDNWTFEFWEPEMYSDCTYKIFLNVNK